MQLSQFQWKLLISRNHYTCGLFFFSIVLNRPILFSYAGLLYGSCNTGQAAVTMSQTTPVFHATIWQSLDSAHSSHLSHLLLRPLWISQLKSAIFGWRHTVWDCQFCYVAALSLSAQPKGDEARQKGTHSRCWKPARFGYHFILYFGPCECLMEDSKLNNQIKREAFPALFL